MVLAVPPNINRDDPVAAAAWPLRAGGKLPEEVTFKVPYDPARDAVVSPPIQAN